MFSIVAKQQRDQPLVEANDVVRRHTEKRRDARSFAVAGVKPQGSTADGHDSRESAWAAGVKTERNRRYDNNGCFVRGSRDTRRGNAPNASRVGRGMTPMTKARARPHTAAAVHKRSRSAHPKEDNWDAWPTFQTFGYRTASKARLTKTEPAAPEAPTQNDKDYVYILVVREKMVPMDTRLTDTVQHPVSQNAGPPNVAPLLHTVPMQPVATASQRWRGDSSIMCSARVAVVQPGRCCETIVNLLENEQLVEVLTQHIVESLAVPGASSPGGVKMLVDSGSSITTISEELVQVLRRQMGMTQTALTQAIVRHAHVVTLLGQECDIEWQPLLHLKSDTPSGPVGFTMLLIVPPEKAGWLSSDARR